VEKQLEILKGIHPGLFLERELKKRKLTIEEFANSLDEYPPTLVSISKGKRKMNTDLALKIEKAFGLEEGYLMILQVYYDIDQRKKKKNISHPNLSILRPSLFWDTKIENIDWTKYQNAVINRIFERGNQKEKDEIIRFYGKDVVEKAINEKEA
jgi:addiction module HigA family antidote